MFPTESYHAAAYALHTRSPQLAPLRESYKDMVVNRRMVLCDVVQRGSRLIGTASRLQSNA